jgi:hypothetical protein
MGFQATTESNFVSYNLSCEKLRNVRKIKMKKSTVTTKHMELPRGFSTFPPPEIQTINALDKSTIEFGMKIMGQL